MLAKKLTPLALAAACLLASTAHAQDTVDIDAKAREVAKSLVAIEITLQNENSSQEGSGQGIVVSKDVVLVSGELISESTPKEWIKEIKLRLPSKNFASPVKATILGRTKDGFFAFLKSAEPLDMPIFEPGDILPSKLGQQVFSVGLLSKDGGYETYIGASQIKAIINLRHTTVRTMSFGLTGPNSPVFDTATGKLVGITESLSWDGMTLSDGNSMRRIFIRDEDQGFAYHPAEQIASLFKNVPEEPFKRKRPWHGAEITGLSEDLVALKKLGQPSGVMLGVIIPGEAADKAGLKPQDIILSVDGKQFSKTPVPSIMTQHFERAIDAYNPGDTITLGILRDGKKQDVKLTLGDFPKNPAEMAYVFSPKVGIVTRDLVFTDAYARRLPQDTKGVMIALVKNGSPASLGKTPLHSQYLITKVDETPVEDQKQFLDLMKKLEENPEAKEAVFVVIQPNGQSEVCRIDLTK